MKTPLVDLASSLETARTHHKAGRLTAAEALYTRILEQAPHHPATLNLLGLVKHAKGQSDEGLTFITRALQQRPDAASFHNNHGLVLQAIGRLQEAETAYRQALHLKPAYGYAHYNLGTLLEKQGRLTEALDAFQLAIQHRPDMLEAYIAKATTLQRQGAYVAAETCLRDVLQQHPTHPQTLFAYADLLRVQGRIPEAVRTYHHVLRIQPDFALGYNNLGAALQLLGALPDAATAFRQALALEPDQPEATYNLARTLDDLGHHDEAVSLYERALALNPADAARAHCYLAYLRKKLCDWTDYTARRTDLLNQVRSHLTQPNGVSLPPLTLNVFDVPGALRRAVAEQQAEALMQQMAPIKARCAFACSATKKQKLRIGYVSPDFRKHAVGILIHDLFRHHNREAFEIYAYSLVRADDVYTQNIQAGVDVFVDVSGLSPEATARRIHADGIDILIDMGGYTSYTRTALFALNPAPVQAHWLGYLDTMGAPFLPYLIADPTVITEHMARDFSEAIVYLPDCFAPVSPMTVSTQPITRADAGLPEDAFVFCCFNALHKIDPTCFDVWMRILADVPDSVLWLYEGDTETARTNLRQSAARSGIDPTRLIFARRRSMPEYLAQHRLADVFLDTFVYNAGATALSALYAGLPVLTRPGTTYLSRMGASFNEAIGLPEMTCSNTEMYYEKAVHLATHPTALTNLRTSMANRHTTAPLFNLPRFVQHLETAYHKMWDQHVQNRSPASIHIDA